MLFLLGVIHLVKSKMDDPLDICWKEFSFKKWRFQEHQWSSMNNNSKKLVIQSTIYARTITVLIIKTKLEHRVFNSNDASLAFNLCCAQRAGLWFCFAIKQICRCYFFKYFKMQYTQWARFLKVANLDVKICSFLTCRHFALTSCFEYLWLWY